MQDEEGRKNTAEEEISVTPFHYSSQKGHRGEVKSGDGETKEASPTPKDGEQQREIWGRQMRDEGRGIGMRDS